ncbi:alpha/beta fold hydrolase [Stackebrandtia nassauensis]|uniref:Alpha/beta hydrolase fold protein n=1 Tax=Stackebrandtia nassauensis (strain DSM 44728 / CIP 108903 / NRRL B-16338 / NBRC 102104 / LLR-40K-21) TaxID=446470 RepID=D3Q821_STANL|nr:alpha/beta hydrolase [Stackebrandtia nassauensis]ADD40526.1 alpha/beta hydrolase fold protein [Stackebrandtia nassauensis DSM 44728]
MREIKTRDGRTLAVEEWGVPGGTPLLYAHGTPVSRLARYPYDEAFTERGIRQITFDRPGYGYSTANPGRRVADVAADMAAIADALELERFGVYGVSGGGPHALAFAAAYPERVSRVAVLACTAPRDAEGLDWTADMYQGNRDSATAAAQGREVLTAHLAAASGPNLKDLLPEAEQAVIAEPAVASMMQAAFAEAFRNGQDGWIDDELALYALPWGFDPADITVPVRLWHGERDTLVPPAHSDWLAARIPDATLVREPDAGHAGHFRATPSTLDWLLGAD